MDAGLPFRHKYVAETLSALAVRSGEQALVSGADEAAEAAAEVLTQICGKAPERVIPGRAPTAGALRGSPVDVLVDTSGDAGWWPIVMARVRRQGRVLLLIPLGSYSCAFDFYDRVHRASLTLLVRRVALR